MRYILSLSLLMILAACYTEHHWAREAADGAVSAGYEVGMGDFHRGSGLVQLMLSGDGVAVSELRYSTCP